MRKQNLIQMVLVGSLMAGGISWAWADDTSQLKDQVQALQNRVDQLEAQQADPFAQMMQMQAQMDRNMHQAMADTGMAFAPRMDMKQTDKKYIITLDIPGMDKDKINVETKDGMLTISGERKSETEDSKNNQYYRQERSFGAFMQAIPLPDDVKTDRIEANYKNGVLTVTIERKKKVDNGPQSQKITVN